MFVEITLIARGPRQASAFICKCNIGEYKQGCFLGVSDCSDCGMGQYQDQNSHKDTRCKSCPQGWYAGVNKATTCTDCAPGKYSQTAMSSCIACSVGQYQDDFHASGCKLCPAGKHAESGGASACTDCEPGKYSQMGMRNCLECPGGQHQDSYGESICKECAVGKHRNRGLDASECARCRPGFFSQDKGQVNCDRCAGGRYQINSGQTNCIACERGKYRPHDAQGYKACSPCSVGFANTGEGNFMCYPIPPGSFFNSTASQMMPCRSGAQCKGLNHSMRKCFPGRYAPSPGLSRCLKCAPGRFAPSFGLANCSICPIGWMATDRGSTYCVRPNSDQIVGSGGMSSYAVALGWRKVCNENSTCYQVKCIAGTIGTQPPSGECRLCPVGQSSFEGALECSHCDLGKYSSAQGSKNCTACNNEKREYADSRGSFSCKICDAGKYSNGIECKEAIDTGLPIPKHVRVLQMGNSTYIESVLDQAMPGAAFAAVVWECDMCSHKKVHSLDVRISLRGRTEMGELTDFVYVAVENISLLSEAASRKVNEGIVVHGISKFESIIRWIPLQFPLWQMVVTAQVRVVGVNTLRGTWSSVSLPWTTIQQCGNYSDDAAFLDNGVMKRQSLKRHHLQNVATDAHDSLVDPAEMFSCIKCPTGASCNGAVTFSGIVAQRGWWQCPARTNLNKPDIPLSRNMTQVVSKPDFTRCLYADACLGQDGNVAYQGNFVAKLDTENMQEDQTISTSAQNAFFSNVSKCNFGYKNSVQENRLCHECDEGFVHSGQQGKCVACPGGVWGKVTPILWILAAFIFIFSLIGLKIRSTGNYKAPHSVIRRVMIHHLQTLVIVISMNVEWPRVVHQVAETVSSVVSTEYHLAAISCLFRNTGGENMGEASNGAHSFYLQVAVLAVLPLILAGIAYMYWLYVAIIHIYLRCGVKELRASKIGDCCKKWSMDETMMIPEPPPISQEADGRGSIAINIQALSLDPNCRNPTQTKRPAINSFLRIHSRSRHDESSNLKGLSSTKANEFSRKHGLSIQTDMSRISEGRESAETPFSQTSFGKATPMTREKMIMGSYFSKSSSDCAMASTILVLYVFQPGIVRMAFSVLQCDMVCGDSFLHRDLHEGCWQGSHLTAVTLLAMPTILCYAVLMPVFGIFLLYRHKSIMFANKKLVFRYGMMYSGFRRERWWWDAVTLFRKFIMILIVTFARSWKRQLHLGLGVQVIFFHLQHVGLPYRQDSDGKKLHRVELASLITLLLMTWIAVFFSVSECPENDMTCNGLALLVGTSNIVFVVWSLWLGCVFFNQKEKVLHKLKKAGMKLQRRVKKRVSEMSGTKPRGQDVATVTSKSNEELDEEMELELSTLETNPAKNTGDEKVYSTSRPRFDEEAPILSPARSSSGWRQSRLITNIVNPLMSKAAVRISNLAESPLASRLRSGSRPTPIGRQTFADLPEGWYCAADEAGNVYFYSESGETQWEIPKHAN